MFCPGAEYGPAKRWPYFGELAERVALPVVLIGSAKERAQCAAIKGRNLAGETTLDEAIELIAGAQLVVANDSGLMHVAAALGRPQVALFGSSSPQHTPPLSDKARVLWLGIECSPCYARECPLGHFRCMKELSVEHGAGETGVRPCFPRNGKIGSDPMRIFPTPQDAEAAFYEALERADLELMMAVWAEDEEILCVHPGGARLTGQDQVRDELAPDLRRRRARAGAPHPAGGDLGADGRGAQRAREFLRAGRDSARCRRWSRPTSTCAPPRAGA